MASEILAVPEDHLQEFINILKVGMANYNSITPDVNEALTKWIEDEEDYLQRMTDEEE